MNTSIDPSLLLPLYALLSERSVSKAAVRLRRSQPAMSHALARLRKVIGDPLLVPRGPVVDITPRAVALLEPVRRLVADFEQLLGPSGAQFEAATTARDFRLAATELFQTMLLPPLLQHLARVAPAVHVSAQPLQGDELAEQLETGELDVALTSLDGLEARRGLRTRVVLVDRYVCVLRAGHPAATHLTPELFSRLEHVAVAPRGRANGPVDKLLSDRKTARRVVATTSSFFAAGAVIARSDLIGILPERALATFAEREQVIALPLPVSLPPIRLGALWHLRFDRDVGHRWFRSQVSSICKQLGPVTRALR